VLAPPPDAPEEELMSLVYFYEADHDAVIETLPPPIGRTSYPPVCGATTCERNWRRSPLAE